MSNWPLTEEEIERYTAGECFLLAWALDQLMCRAGAPPGRVVLSWLPEVDDDALHAAYVTHDNRVIDAHGIRPLATHLELYGSDGWHSTLAPATRLKRDGYVYPADKLPHDEALRVAQKILRTS